MTKSDSVDIAGAKGSGGGKQLHQKVSREYRQRVSGRHRSLIVLRLPNNPTLAGIGSKFIELVDNVISDPNKAEYPEGSVRILHDMAHCATITWSARGARSCE
jgi:hypothetical protein